MGDSSGRGLIQVAAEYCYADDFERQREALLRLFLFFSGPERLQSYLLAGLVNEERRTII